MTPLGEQSSLSFAADSGRLPLKLRNQIQEVILLRLPEDQRGLWVENYAAEAAQIMDGSDDISQQIRQLAMTGKIEEAAELLQSHLSQLQEIDN